MSVAAEPQVGLRKRIRKDNPMKQHPDNLHQQLASLREAFSRLVSHLNQAAKELQAPGVPPSEKLVEALTTARTDFAALLICRL